MYRRRSYIKLIFNVPTLLFLSLLCNSLMHIGKCFFLVKIIQVCIYIYIYIYYIYTHTHTNVIAYFFYNWMSDSWWKEENITLCMFVTT